MKTIALLLLTLLSLVAPVARAQALKKDKLTLGPWEQEIGYTQAIRIGRTLYISGSTGDGLMPEALAKAYGTIKRTLEHYHLNFSHVVKENVYTTDIEALKQHVAVRRTFYGEDFPVATWVQVARLYNPGQVIEVEIVAVLPDAPETAEGPSAQ